MRYLCHDECSSWVLFSVFCHRLTPKNKLAFLSSWDAAPSIVTCPLVIYVHCEICKLHYCDSLHLQCFIKFPISHKCPHMTKINHILRCSHNRKPLPFCLCCSLQPYLRSEGSASHWCSDVVLPVQEVSNNSQSPRVWTLFCSDLVCDQLMNYKSMGLKLILGRSVCLLRIL